jgi:hypothetical protein
VVAMAVATTGAASTTIFLAANAAMVSIAIFYLLFLVDVYSTRFTADISG